MPVEMVTRPRLYFRKAPTHITTSEIEAVSFVQTNLVAVCFHMLTWGVEKQMPLMYLMADLKLQKDLSSVRSVNRDVTSRRMTSYFGV